MSNFAVQANGIAHRYGKQQALSEITFSLPAGQNGTNGADGIQGLPGEVTNAALAMSISGTSANTNSVSTLDTAFADPDMEALRAKMNELILNGRR